MAVPIHRWAGPMKKYSIRQRDMLTRMMHRLDAVIALIESLPDPCAREFWASKVAPSAVEWHVLAATEGLVDFPPRPGCEPAGRCGAAVVPFLVGLAGGAVAAALAATWHADTFEVRGTRRLKEIVNEIDRKEVLDARARACIAEFQRRAGLSWVPSWVPNAGGLTLRVLAALGIITVAVAGAGAAKGAWDARKARQAV